MAQHGYIRENSEGWERGEDRDHDWRERDRDRNRGFMFGDQASGDREQGDVDDWREERRNFRSDQDDHYRSWRQKQIEALDRDYDEYCREREQQFHQDFTAWRQQRRGNPQPLQPGMAQSGLESDPTDILELKGDTAVGGPSEPDPTATATLGTSSTSR